MREGARRLARTGRRVDPALVEEAPRDPRHLRRERVVGGQHRVAGLRPRDRALLDARQRRIAVPVGQRLLPEPLRFERVVAVGQAGIGCPHRVDEGFHHLGLDPVRQVARVRDILEPAPAVADLLVLRQRVGDEREDPQLAAQHRADRAGRLLADRAVRILKLVERRLQRHLLALHGEAQRGDRLVEQPVPGGVRRDRLLEKQLLGAVIELVRLLAPQVLDPRGVVRERPSGHRGVDRGVVDAVQLQGEEEEIRRGAGQPLAGVAVELGPRLVGGVAGIHEPRERHELAEQVLDPLVGPHRLGQTRGRVRPGGELGDPAGIGLGEAAALLLGASHVAGEVRIIEAGIEIREVPFRKMAEVGGLRGGARGTHALRQADSHRRGGVARHHGVQSSPRAPAPYPDIERAATRSTRAVRRTGARSVTTRRERR